MLEHDVPVPLTTPAVKDFDSAFPGENWFFYWKTSSSLWERKLRQLPKTSRVIIPINWAFHSETGNSYDFARIKPETDLKKLLQVARSVGKEPVFFLPLGPCPFLPNGGLPALLARTPALDEDLRNRVFVDQDGNIHRMYSFFDNRIFKGFSKFVRELGQYFSQAGLDCDLLGFEPGYIDLDGFKSYLLDHSKVFKQGFLKYIEARRENQALQEGGDFLREKEQLTLEQEYEWELSFVNTIRRLYCEEAKTALMGNWEGHLKVGFLGGASDAIFSRMYDKDKTSAYCQELVQTLSLDVLPSSILLPARLKQGVLGRMLADLVIDSFLELKLDNSHIADDFVSHFRPLSFFEVFDLSSKRNSKAADWSDLGLWDYLKKAYSWCFFDRSNTTFQWSETTEAHNRIFFFHGFDVDKDLFHNILKTFMSGGKVVLNRSGLREEYLRKLETFFLENSLKVEKVNFHCPVHNVTLGEGRMLILEASKLTNLGSHETLLFWSKLLNTFQINYLAIPEMEGILNCWRFRATGYHELNYEEIRRLSLYNPTSYKRKVRIPIPKRFRLLKIVDEVNTRARSHSHELEVELLPEASVAIDFGVFS